MGKSQTRGRQGLYLKGKGVVRVQDFIPNRRFVQVSLRICFDFFDYASVLFLHPEVFTEHGMRPGRHGHRDAPRAVREERRMRLAPVGRRWTAQGGAVSTGNGGHGQAAPCSGSGNGHRAGFDTGLGSGRFNRVGRAVVTVDFGPLPYRN
jgi:hypothetical protein